VPVLTPYDLRWSADDDLGVTSVDLYCSLDGGATWPITLATDEPDDGHFTWDVPLPGSQQAMIKVVARDASGNRTEATSRGPFRIARARTRTYDFRVGAGIDRWAWGGQVGSPAEIEGTRHPAGVSTEIGDYSGRAYGAISRSDSTGGDGDPFRYISSVPTAGAATAHIFEFTLYESVSCLQEIRLLWEGYGDLCMEMELYVWDDVEGNWGDLEGLFGLDRYAANFAGNRDEALEAHITKDFHRYVDARGRITFLVVSDRGAQESFHDYVEVRTTYVSCP